MTEPNSAEPNDLPSEFETTPDLVLITDPFGLFLRVSPSIKNLLGYERDEIEGRLAIDFIHPLDLAETRDEMRASRQTGRVRHFYCRYIHKSHYSVELVWSGMWLEDKGEYVFIGRKPPARERLPFVHRVDALDGFQVAKGLFALSLVLAWVFDLGNNATFEVRRLVEHFDGNAVNWVVIMGVYAVACLICLAWKHRLIQFIVSIISILIWVWMGFVTLAAPHYVAAAGVYEMMLGLASVYVLYFRGRQL
jgi:PAS domain S-box-containing protein